MHHVVIGVDDNAEHTLMYVEEVTKPSDEPGEKEVTPTHSFADNPSGTSTTRIRSIREAGEFLEDYGIEYDVGESLGDPVEVIIESADEEDADLIVTTGRKRSPADKALFGNVTQTVIPNSDRPAVATESTKRKR